MIDIGFYKKGVSPFALWVGYKLLDNNMNQTELAESVGCGKVYISKILRGTVKSSMYCEKIITVLAKDEEERVKSLEEFLEYLEV